MDAKEDQLMVNGQRLNVYLEPNCWRWIMVLQTYSLHFALSLIM
jgi:hypothetical protein